MTPDDTPDFVAINRESWTRSNAEYTDAQAEGRWAETEITWGVWGVSEDTVRVLPSVRGKDVIELGCGTGYVGAWLKRRGARRVVGVDITPAQLVSARRADARAGLGLEFLEASAEAVPLPGDSFDLGLGIRRFDLVRPVPVDSRGEGQRGWDLSWRYQSRRPRSRPSRPSAPARPGKSSTGSCGR